MKREQMFKWSAVIIALVLLSGCMSVIDSINMVDSGIARTKASANQAVADAIGIGELEDSMVAFLVYSQAFFAGGYVQGYGDFTEGEGVVWKIIAEDGETPEESESIEIERALLKRTAEGNSWWLLRYTDEEGEELVSESLLNDDYEMLVFRYRDPETQKIREWKPESEEETAETEGEEEESGEEAEVEDLEAAYFYGDYRDHVVGTEKVRVPAGTYTTDHVRIVDSYTVEDEEGNSESYEIRYEWWIDEDVPGDLVKYEWTNETENSVLKGELIKHKRGYSTQLESF